MENTELSREEKILFYNRVVSLHPHAEYKGNTMPHTAVNGHMNSYFNKDNFVALRLPEAEKLKFMEKYKTVLVEQYGIIQKNR